jgi:cytochrome P450
MSVTAHLDPFGAVAPGHRHDTYQALAQDTPVRRIATPSGNPAWLVTGYSEARQALTDPRLAKAPSPATELTRRLVPELSPALTTHMLQFDPPVHTRLRRLVGGVFTRHRVAGLAPRIQQIADELLDAVGDADEIDLIPAYALPLPMTVICELIGIPESDRADFRRWSETLAEGLYADPDVYTAAATEQIVYVRELVEHKRRHPADDLLTALVTQCQDGDRLSRDELTSMVWILVLAGHETTVNLIANGVQALLTHPRQLAALRAEPPSSTPR